MHSVSSNPFQQSISPTPQPPAFNKPHSPVFTLQCINTKTAADVKKVYVKTIASTLNDWEDIIKSRLKVSASEENFLSDKKMVNAYCDLLETTRTYVAEFERKKEQKFSHIMVLTDSDARIQALAALVIKDNSDRVVVETLISAPWNVPMKSENINEHQHLCIKGAGTTMMRQIYELALVKEKKKVVLRPLDSARSFYVDTLKMKTDEQSVALYYDVSPDNLPEKLQVSSGNLLSKLQNGIKHSGVLKPNIKGVL